MLHKLHVVVTEADIRLVLITADFDILVEQRGHKLHGVVTESGIPRFESIKADFDDLVEPMWDKLHGVVTEPDNLRPVSIKAGSDDLSSLRIASSLFEARVFGPASAHPGSDLGWRQNHELRYPRHEADDRHHWWPFSNHLSWRYSLPSQLRTARVQSLGSFKLLGALAMLPITQGRPISKAESFGAAMGDQMADTLRQFVIGTLSWFPPATLLGSFLYLVRRMPPETYLQEHRMMSAAAALGPSVLSDLRTSLPWWSLINVVSWISLVQYARACSPGFHRSQCLLGSVVVGSVVLACTLCYASSPSQGVDSSLFGRLLGPSFWMVLVMLDLVSKRRAWLRQCLQSLMDILI